MRTIIIYATKYGSVEHAIDLLKPRIGGDIVTINILKEQVPDISGFDTVILGGSIYAGRIQKKLAKYAVRNLPELLTKRIGLFICAAQKPEIREKELFDAFPFELYEHAVSKEAFGYEIHIDQMNFIEKKLVGALMGTKENRYELSEDTIEEFSRTLIESK